MSAREDLYAYTTVAFKETGVPPVVHAHVTKLLDAYRSEVLAKAVGRLRAIPVQCTALTGPVWYGTGWREAITQLEEIADYQKPDDEDYPGELALLRALVANVRLRARQSDLAFVQQLVEQHHQADKEARRAQQTRTA